MPGTVPVVMRLGKTETSRCYSDVLEPDVSTAMMYAVQGDRRLEVRQDRGLIIVDIWIFKSMCKYTWLGNMRTGWISSSSRADDGPFWCIIRDIGWQDVRQASAELTMAVQS